MCENSFSLSPSLSLIHYKPTKRQKGRSKINDGIKNKFKHGKVGMRETKEGKEIAVIIIKRAMYSNIIFDDQNEK